jgi:hypothetical protein
MQVSGPKAEVLSYAFAKSLHAGNIFEIPLLRSSGGQITAVMMYFSVTQPKKY